MKSAFLIAGLCLATNAQAALKSTPVDYKDGQTVLEGYLVYDDTLKGPRPGVIVVHDWLGPGDFSRGRADELAKLGYVAFAADIYGKGVRPKDSQEASAQAGRYKSDRPLLRTRAKAALNALLAQPQTDAQRVAVIGYCFGGTTALELARAGAPLAGSVSFHGGLSTPAPQDAKQIKGRVLVLHGADDPHVPPAEVAAFEKEMTEAKVDFQLIRYAGAVHAFAVPSAGSDVSKGAAYNASADKRSWKAMKEFLNKLLAAKPA